MAEEAKKHPFEDAGLVIVPGEAAAAEDVGRLEFAYVDGVPVLTLHDGTAVPGAIAVVDPQGAVVAVYTPGAVAQPQSRVTAYSSVNNENAMRKLESFGAIAVSIDSNLR